MATVQPDTMYAEKAARADGVLRMQWYWYQYKWWWSQLNKSSLFCLFYWCKFSRCWFVAMYKSWTWFKLKKKKRSNWKSSLNVLTGSNQVAESRLRPPHACGGSHQHLGVLLMSHQKCRRNSSHTWIRALTRSWTGYRGWWHHRHLCVTSRR